MTKNDELLIIRRAIAELGSDSYLGPWLAEVVWELESLIRSDILPEVSLKATADTCAHRLAVVEGECREIKARAERQAKALLDAARKERDQVQNRLLESIRQAERAVCA